MAGNTLPKNMRHLIKMFEARANVGDEGVEDIADITREAYNIAMASSGMKLQQITNNILLL